MSAEWQLQAGESWKLSLPCTRAESEAIAALDDPMPGVDPPPVVMTSEPDPAAPDAWRLDLYSEGPPSAALIARLRTLAPSAADQEPAIERIADADWVTISQAWLEPIRAGRFYVHTASHADAIPAGATNFLIEAGRAFGTGHHETTAGCLALLDRLASEGAAFASIADIGTGTGLLAFAARALWPAARLLASDIDPIAIEVMAGNMAANAIPVDAIRRIAAPGVDHPAIAAAAPFDLIVANILAGPLIALAPDLARVAAPGATIVLAGLLATQEQAVLEAYREQGFVPAIRLPQGDWPALAIVGRLDRA